MPSPSAWTPVRLPGAARAIAARGASALAALDDGRLYHSADGGATWGAVGAGAPGTAALLWLDGAVLAGGEGGVVRAAEAERWGCGAPVPFGAAVTAFAARDTTAIAGTLGAGVYRSSDGGVAWEAAGAGLPLGGRDLRIFSATAGRGGLVVAHALGVSRSTDGGHSWSSAGVGLPFQIPHAALAADGGGAFYASVAGRLYRSVPADAGSTALLWSETYDGAGRGRPLSLLGGWDGVLYAAVGGPPFLVRSGDGGVSWQAVRAGLPGVPVGLAAGAPWLLAVLADGSVWRATRPARPVARRVPDVELQVLDGPARVGFSLGAPVRVTVTVHDLHDREVAVLAEGAYAAGRHTVGLGGLAPGLYRCRLRAGAASRSAPLFLSGT